MGLKEVVNNLVEMVNDLENELVYQKGKYDELQNSIMGIDHAHNMLMQALLQIPYFKEMDHNEFFEFCKRYKLIR